MSADSSTLDCPNCDSAVFEADTDGMFWDGAKATCQECGLLCSVSADSENAAHISSDEHAEDIGQPRCLNECDMIYMGSPALVAEFLGSACRWDCDKFKAWSAAGRPTIANINTGAVKP